MFYWRPSPASVRVIAYPDAELTRLGIDEGDTVRLDHHTLIKL